MELMKHNSYILFHIKEKHIFKHIIVDKELLESIK